MSFENNYLQNVATRLVNKCMSMHLNANVSLDSNANAFSRSTFKCKCFGVALKCICSGYTFANAFELISNILALYERFFWGGRKLFPMACCDHVNVNLIIIIIQRITHAFDCAFDK